MKLLHALVSIAAALKLSAIKHPLESRDINELYDKVDASLRECMNSTSMDVPLNVKKRKRSGERNDKFDEIKRIEAMSMLTMC